MTTKLQKEIIDLLAKYDIFMDISNPIIASAEAEKFTNDIISLFHSLVPKEKEVLTQIELEEMYKENEGNVSWDEMAMADIKEVGCYNQCCQDMIERINDKQK